MKTNVSSNQLQNETGAALWDGPQTKTFLGLRCKTNHTLRNFEKRGLLHPIRLGTRTYRYDPAEVRALIENSRSGKGVAA